jgi:hypothetical protein
MPFLIDGYNLLHALGLLHGRTGPNGLAKARAALLGLVTAAHGDAAGEVTVVFDARHARGGAEDSEHRGGVHVEFTRGEDADDRIEWLIAHDPAPKRLVVVSDDHRLQQAARRRSCVAWKCGDYLDWLDRRRRPRQRSAPAEEKPSAAGSAEADRWQAVFGDLDREPAWDELFGPDFAADDGA